MATVHADEKGGWQLVEDSAESYERYLVPALFTAMADRLLDLAELKAGERLLDVGCGTGIVARRAGPRVGPGAHIVAFDLNDGMLAVARRVSSAIRPAVEWRRGDAAALPLPDAAFDVVTCQQAMQFFADRPGALREMRRVLAPGGRAAIAVLRPIRFTPVYEPVAQALERHAGVQAGAMMRSPFPDWDSERFRAIVAEGGFDQVRIRVDVGSVRYPSSAELLRQEAAASPLAGPLAALPPGLRDALVRDVDAALADYKDDDGITFPMASYVALARR